MWQKWPFLEILPILEVNFKHKGLAKRLQHFDTTQHLTTFLRDDATCVVLNGLAKRRNLFNIITAACDYLCARDSWYATSGPSAHTLVKQCCVNVAKRVHHTTSKMLHGKFHRYQI